MSQPARKDLELYRGDTDAATVRLWQDAIDGTPIDLAGATVAAEIRTSIGGPLLATLTAAVNGNEINLSIPAAAWATFPAVSSAAWDLEVTFPDGRVRTYLAGSVSIAGDVTNPA